MNCPARRIGALACAVAGFVALFCVPVHASLRLCNRTGYVLYAATGSQQASRISTRGWTRIFPGDCATAIAGPLNAPAYFVYARAGSFPFAPSRSWGGQFRFCVRSNEFALQERVSATRCGGKDDFDVPFAPVPKGNTLSWTTTFTESANLSSPDKARAAGFRRLLSALDRRVGDGDVALDAAIRRFRAQAKLATGSSTDDIFSALETAADKAGGPEGYVICNNGNSDIWAALGMKAGGEFVSHGWWDVASGNCVSAVASALGRDPVYLFASKADDTELVGGPAQFCISNREFDIPGRARCNARGYLVAGFLPTNPNGSPGFVAHVGKDGLLSPQAATPK